MTQGKRAEGAGQGWAQQHRRDLIKKEENSCHSAENQLGDSLAETKFLGSFGQGEVNLDVR